MEYLLLKIEGAGTDADPEKITVLQTGEDLPELYAERDRLLDTNGHKLAECRYAVRLAPAVKAARKNGKNKSV